MIRTSLRPVLRTVKDTKNLDAVSAEPVNGEIRQATKHQLPCIWLPACAPELGELSQDTNALANRKRHTAGGCGAPVLANVIANLSKITDCGISPADTHQPGYRSSINFLTSS